MTDMTDAAVVEDVVEELVGLGVLSPGDLEVADALARLWSDGPVDPLVRLGAALAVRAPRMGHVCCALTRVAESVTSEVASDARSGESPDDQLDALAWPAVVPWLEVLAASPLVQVVESGNDAVGVSGARPLVLWGTRLYLQRLWTQEAQVASRLLAMASESVGEADDARVTASQALIDALLPGELAADQRRAVARAGARRLGVIAGGPGTGKTTTIAALLVAAHVAAGGDPLRVVLAAPTGKAAARVNEALRDALGRFADAELPAEQAASLSAALDGLAGVEATTLHRLLGAGGGARSTFRHDSHNPLPYDVVVVDEASMVALPLMAHLLEAIGRRGRLMLVGDPHQLASVEAGSVLADIVGPAAVGPSGDAPLAEVISVLATNFRFAEDSGIATVAAAVNAGASDDVLAALEGTTEVVWHPLDAASDGGRAEVVAAVGEAGAEVVALARSGDAEGALDALQRCQLLCAHRRGPYGVERWNAVVGAQLGVTNPAPAGRPVLVTRNDDDLGVFNGDVGVSVADPSGSRVAFGVGSGVRRLAPVQLEHAETAHALTIHKSQGSEFDVVVVVLPPAGSRLASRQLLYTAVTRARRQVVVVGPATAVRASVERSLVRQGGLAERLWGDTGP